jgi:hypothetical protein
MDERRWQAERRVLRVFGKLGKFREKKYLLSIIKSRGIKLDLSSQKILSGFPPVTD